MEEAIILQTNGTKTGTKPKNGTDFDLEELQFIVNGSIEIVRLSDNKILVINEEGKLHNLPLNKLATVLLHVAYPGTSDYIVGDVLLCDSEMVK